MIIILRMTTSSWLLTSLAGYACTHQGFALQVLQQQYSRWTPLQCSNTSLRKTSSRDYHHLEKVEDLISTAALTSPAPLVSRAEPGFWQSPNMEFMTSRQLLQWILDTNLQHHSKLDVRLGLDSVSTAYFRRWTPRSNFRNARFCTQHTQYPKRLWFPSPLLALENHYKAFACGAKEDSWQLWVAERRE